MSLRWDYRFCVCLDDKHYDCQSEHDRHVRVIRHAAGRSGRGGWHSYVTWQQLWSVRLSRMADESPALGFDDYLDVRNCDHCIRALHSRSPSNMVQCEYEEAYLSKIIYSLLHDTRARV